MFINKIILNNFRIFRGKHLFNFSNKKVIVIEGPNGYGKSTIFDAINWGISGRISRYIGTSEHQQFNYIINNYEYLYGKPEASVEIFFESKQGINIKRIIQQNGSTKILINGKNFGVREGQREIVRLLINEEIINDTKLLESIDLPSFIESTLILSQENLEEFVRRDKPTERYSKLEKILGLSRYGQDFKEYLQILKKECSKQYSDISLEQDKLKHEKELLDVQYKQKSLQNEREGNKSKQEIIDKLNLILNFSKESFIPMDRRENFHEISLEEYKILKKYIEDIESAIKDLSNLKIEIQQNEINISEVEFDKRSKILKGNISSTQLKKAKRESGIKKASLKKDKLNKIVQVNEYLLNNEINKEKLEVDIKNLRKQINTIFQNLGLEIKSPNSQILRDYIEKFEKNNIYLKELLRKSIIIENENTLNNLLEETKKVSEKDKKNTDLRNKLKDQIESIEKNITELSKQKDSKLDSQIHNLIYEVQTHLVNSNSKKCLVCGATYRDSEELKKSIRIQLDFSSKQLNSFEKQINEYKVSKNELISKLNILQQDSVTYQRKLNKLNDEIINLKERTSVMRLQNQIKLEDHRLIQQEIENAQVFKSQNEVKYNGIVKIDKLLSDLNDLIFKKKQMVDEENNLINQHKNYINYIRNDEKLRQKINRLNNYLVAAKIKIKEYNNDVQESEQLIKQSYRKIQMLVHIRNHLSNLINSVEVDLDSNIISNIITEKSSFLESQKYEAKNALILIGHYLNNIELRELESKIKENDQKILIQKNRLDKYSRMEMQLTNLVAYHAQVQSSLVNEYLDELSSTINKYFRQISPHSYSNYISLLTKKNELYVLLTEEQLGFRELEKDLKDSVNASLTLSAAQSTILAMSIFLALNESQNWSKLNLIGIDDPFQNLDDINAYSFIDVMTFLISTENRQIFISTHDSDFAKLSIRKMSLDSDEYAYIKIQSYTKEAIVVQSEQYKSILE